MWRIISLSCSMCAPSAYSVPSASNVTRRSARAEACTCGSGAGGGRATGVWRGGAQQGGDNGGGRSTHLRDVEDVAHLRKVGRHVLAAGQREEFVILLERVDQPAGGAGCGGAGR